jgi:hypothetical protein
LNFVRKWKKNLWIKYVLVSFDAQNSLHSQNKNTKKEQIQVQYRNGAKDVLFLESKMFFICKKMFFFQEQIMICSWKSNIFDPFSVLDLNPNEKKNTISKSVAEAWGIPYARWWIFVYGPGTIRNSIILKSTKSLSSVWLLHFGVCA